MGQGVVFRTYSLTLLSLLFFLISQDRRKPPHTPTAMPSLSFCAVWAILCELLLVRTLVAATRKRIFFNYEVKQRQCCAEKRTQVKINAEESSERPTTRSFYLWWRHSCNLVEKRIFSTDEQVTLVQLNFSLQNKTINSLALALFPPPLPRGSLSSKGGIWWRHPI